MATLGVSKDDRMRVVNHSSGDVHDRHYDKSEHMAEKRAALEVWGAALARMVGEPAKPPKVVPMKRKRVA
jgi:hypothetical protein